MLSTILFASLLVFLSLGLLAWHYNAWQAVDHGGLGERDHEFYRRQFRRRMIGSGMIGIVGLLMISSLWIEDTLQAAIFWSGILFILFWMVLLALSDVWATRMHYSREDTVQKAEYLVLQAEIRKFQSERESAEPKDSST